MTLMLYWWNILVSSGKLTIVVVPCNYTPITYPEYLEIAEYHLFTQTWLVSNASIAIFTVHLTEWLMRPSCTPPLRDRSDLVSKTSQRLSLDSASQTGTSRLITSPILLYRTKITELWLFIIYYFWSRHLIFCLLIFLLICFPSHTSPPNSVFRKCLAFCRIRNTTKKKKWRTHQTMLHVWKTNTTIDDIAKHDDDH